MVFAASFFVSLLMFVLVCHAKQLVGSWLTGQFLALGSESAESEPLLTTGLPGNSLSYLFSMNTPWIVSSLWVISKVLKRLILIIFPVFSLLLWKRGFPYSPFPLMSPPQIGFWTLFSCLKCLPSELTVVQPLKPMRSMYYFQLQEVFQALPNHGVPIPPAFQRGLALSTMPPWPHSLWVLFTLRWQEWSSWNQRAHLSISSL